MNEMAQVFSAFLFDNQADWYSEIDEMRNNLQEIIFMLGTKQARTLVNEMKLGIELDEHSTVVFRFMQLEGFLRELQYRLEDTMELFALLNCDLDKQWIENLIEDLKVK